MTTGAAIAIAGGAAAAGGLAYLALRSPAPAATLGNGATVRLPATGLIPPPPAPPIQSAVQTLQALNTAGCKAVVGSKAPKQAAALGCSVYTNILSPIGSLSIANRVITSVPVVGKPIKAIENTVSKVANVPIKAIASVASKLKFW
jgi:hypothetical protein